MQYRILGKTRIEVSTLGFGLMRLPPKSGIRMSNAEYADIDEEKAIPLVRHAIDRGITVLDTGYGYHGGHSEEFAANVLRDGYRDKVTLMTKLPLYAVQTEDDFERLLNEQMRRLETDHIDVYLLHGLNRARWKRFAPLGVTNFLHAAISDGRIGQAGFSFHDNLDVFQDIVDSYDWSVVLIQLNLMDRNYQAGVAGMRYAAERDIGVAIMEPLRGGRLAGRVPREVADIWRRMYPERTAAEWAFRWLCNFPEVGVVLSGMSSREEVDENVDTFSDALPNSMTDEEIALVDEARDAYHERMAVKCTECGYCVPCPKGVAIPKIFQIYNDITMYGDRDVSGHVYAHMLREGVGCPSCIGCGLCVDSCPQDIAIPTSLGEAHRVLLDAAR